MDLFSVLSQWVHLHVLYNKATAIRNAFTWDFEIIVIYHLSFISSFDVKILDIEWADRKRVYM